MLVLLFFSLAVFCVYYCYDGLLRERPFEIIAYGLTIFVISVYVIVNFIVEGEERELVNVVSKGQG